MVWGNICLLIISLCLHCKLVLHKPLSQIIKFDHFHACTRVDVKHLGKKQILQKCPLHWNVQLQFWEGSNLCLSLRVQVPPLQNADAGLQPWQQKLNKKPTVNWITDFILMNQMCKNVVYAFPIFTGMFHKLIKYSTQVHLPISCY